LGSPSWNIGYTSAGGISGHKGKVSYCYNVGQVKATESQAGGIIR